MILVPFMVASFRWMGSRLASISVIAGLGKYGQASDRQRYEENQQYEPFHDSSLFLIANNISTRFSRHERFARRQRFRLI